MLVLELLACKTVAMALLDLEVIGDRMTRKQWMFILVIGIASAIFFWGFTTIWLNGSTARNAAVAPRGPWLWDGVSIVAGIALGTILRLGLGRQTPNTTHIVIGISVLVFLGVLTFFPWSNDSPVRSLVLPLLELLFSAWLTAGDASTSQR